MKRRWLQFGMRSLLVAFLVVAAFLAGRESQAWLERGTLPTDFYSMRLTVGQTMILDCKRPVPQMWNSEPRVCRMTPDSRSMIKIEALTPGTAKLTLRFEGRAESASYDVVVRPAQ